MTPEEAQLCTLKQYSTCDVSNALLKLNYPHGGILPNISLWSPLRQAGDTKIAGPAYTVLYVPKGTLEQPLEREHYVALLPSQRCRLLALTMALDIKIDTDSTGAVILIDSPQTINAVYRGLMTNHTKYSKAVGTVVNGRIRDLQEHRELGFPVIAFDVGTAGPHEVAEVSGANVQLNLKTDEQDITVHPEDYILGDLNGVVCIPKQKIGQILALLDAGTEAEKRIVTDIRAGVKFAVASKRHRQNL
ncbi:hypothetical protein NM208_g14477 [Fusarium decemcellulare]|uniref:Uncharacterized protein n=1 Tax=Fusarium decemcellulare TaxID=57161 RepID=A0ACC1RHC4_9HYPO|nr:hypothetical protein NM208_g14477 [Fusarium decemcellulare]